MVACKCGDDFVSRANNRVTIQSATVTPDDAGGRDEVWVDSSTVWAVMEPMGGKEVFLSSQLQSRVDERITIRYQAALSDTTVAAKSRVKFGSRIMNIRFVKNLADDMKTEGKVFQQLLCVDGEPS